MKKYNLIFLNNTKVFLSKRNFNSWQEIQDFYENYTTSVGFSSLEELNDYLCFDYNLTLEQTKNLTEKINFTEHDIELVF